MKLGEDVILMCTTTSPSFIKIATEIKKSFINGPFFVFLVHLFSYSLIFLIHFYMNWILILTYWWKNRMKNVYVLVLYCFLDRIDSKWRLSAYQLNIGKEKNN